MINHEQCKDCLNFSRFNPIDGIGDKDNAQIIFIGKNPSREDFLSKNAFSSKASMELFKTLSMLGIHKKICYFTYAIKCIPEEVMLGKEPKIEILNSCNKYLINEIESIPNKKIIVALGKIATKALLPNLGNFSIDKIAGSFFESNFGVPILVVKDPYYLIKNNSPFLYREFYMHLNKVMLYLNNNLQKNEIKNLFIYDSKNINELSDILKQKECISFDIETTDLSFWKSKILCFSFSDGENAYVVESWKMEDDVLKDFFKEIKNVKLILHNGEFDMKHILYKYDVFLNLYYDTLQAQHVLDEESNLDLASLSINLLNAPAYKNNVSFWKLKEEELEKFLNSDDVKDMYVYNALDSFYTYKLYQLQMKQFENEKNSKYFFDTFIMPFLRAVISFTIFGIPIDVNSLLDIKKELNIDIQNIEKQIFEIVGNEFNHKSNDQLALALESIGLNLELLPKTELAKKPKLDKDILQQIVDSKIEANDNVKKVVELLLDMKAKLKLLSTYIQQIDKFLYNNKYTNFPSASPSFKLHASVTYRFNTENPNIHNINRNSIIKKMFCARPGYVFLAADYESAEAFHAAYQAGEHKIIEFVLNPEKDQHKYTASIIFNKKEEEITKEERTLAKLVWFLIQYGGTEYAASHELGISIQDAVFIINGIKKAYPRLFNLLDSFKLMARHNKVLINRFGATRRFKLIKDNAYERQAINFPIQSEVSIYTHLAMLDLFYICQKVGLDKMRPLFSIHDALYFEAHESVFLLCAAIINKVMELPRKGMFLNTSVDFGKNWYELKSLSKSEYGKEYELYMNKDLEVLIKDLYNISDIDSFHKKIDFAL